MPLGYPHDDRSRRPRSRRAVPSPVPAGEVPRSVIARFWSRGRGGAQWTNIAALARLRAGGAERDALCAAVQAVSRYRGARHRHEVQYYPDEFFEPYLSRRGRLAGSLRTAGDRARERAKCGGAAAGGTSSFSMRGGVGVHHSPQPRDGSWARLRDVPGERHDRARARADTCAQARGHIIIR